MKNVEYGTYEFCSVVDPQNLDPDPAYHFDADPEPAFHFDADPDPAIFS
jgi:hypothetical protein